MKKYLSLIALACASHMVCAQTNSEDRYDGLNISFGLAKNSTSETTGGTPSFTTTTSVAKVNYTFGVDFPAKLGVSLSVDLKNSQAGAAEYLATKTPTELTIEPGLVLRNGSLLYAKAGTFAARYESNFGGSALSGSTLGVGIKHYFFEDNFVQFELTTRASDAANVGLGNTKYRQNISSLLVGHTF